MPILLKKIDGSIITLFGGDSADFIGDVVLVKSVIGEVGLEDYILITGLEAFTQDFSSVTDAEFCETAPSLIGPNVCSSHTELTVTF